MLHDLKNSGSPSGLMVGKVGLVLGVANKDSLAWGIAKSLYEQGAKVILTYQNEVFKKRVVPLGESIESPWIAPCDVCSQEDLKTLAQGVKERFGHLDFVVHGAAFSQKEELYGPYYRTTRQNFLTTMEISCFSFTALVQALHSTLKPGSSLLTLSYLGAERVMPNYNVMGVAKAALEASVRYLAVDLGGDGIRVNALSAGPVKTLAASGISDFRYILKWNEENSPLRRNVTQEDVGESALYLLSPLAKGVTGEVLHVDGGYHVVGMRAVDYPESQSSTG